MSTNDDAYDDRSGTPTSVREIVRLSMQRQGLTVRGLAEASGLSAAQINRIRMGKTGRPSLATIAALSKGLDVDGVALAIAAGHPSPADAREVLLEHFPGPEQWGPVLGISRREAARRLKKLRATLEDPATTAGELAGAWLDLHPPLGDLEPVDDQQIRDPSLREVIQAWSQIEPPRRERLLHYVRDQVALSNVNPRQRTAHEVGT